MQKLTIYTDGSCNCISGTGGWAFAVIDGNYDTIHTDCGRLKGTTNNACEIMAAIEAIEWFCRNGEPDKNTLTIVTDSEYLLKGATMWVKSWKNYGWTTKAGEPVKNQLLWERVDELLSVQKVTWRWTKGHKNDNSEDSSNNRYVDKLARSVWDYMVKAP